jgi:hypothetical protein
MSVIFLKWEQLMCLRHPHGSKAGNFLLKMLKGWSGQIKSDLRG